MPLTGEAKAKWQREYQKKRRNALKLLKRQARLRKLDKYNATMTAYNRKRGAKERPVGKKAKPQFHVPKVRRWVIIEDENTGVELAYFNKESGYSLEELQWIVRVLQGKE